MKKPTYQMCGQPLRAGGTCQHARNHENPCGLIPVKPETVKIPGFVLSNANNIKRHMKNKGIGEDTRQAIENRIHDYTYFERQTSMQREHALYEVIIELIDELYSRK